MSLVVDSFMRIGVKRFKQENWELIIYQFPVFYYLFVT